MSKTNTKVEALVCNSILETAVESLPETVSMRANFRPCFYCRIDLIIFNSMLDFLNKGVVPICAQCIRMSKFPPVRVLDPIIKKEIDSIKKKLSKGFDDEHH